MHHDVEEISHSPTCEGRDGNRIPKSEGEEIRDSSRNRVAVELVDDKDDFLPPAAEDLCDFVVRRDPPFFPVDDEENDICLLDRHLGLLAYRRLDDIV